MDARVIFSKEFLDKTKGNELTLRQKGKIWFDRLTELDNSGEINKYTNRTELGRAVGIDDDTRAYRWVANLVNRKHVSETLVATENGKKKFEYHIAHKRYGYGKRNRSKKNRVEERAEQLQRIHDEAVKRGLVKQDKEPGNTSCQITIRYGKVEFIIGDGVCLEYIAGLAKELNKE